MRKVLILLAIIIYINGFSQQAFRTAVFNPDIRTLQILPVGEKYLPPVITLNSDERLEVKFDEMSHEAHNYGYKITHCNADWTPSGLLTTEYLSGYTTANITEYILSQNTTFLYTHYRFQLPNDEIQFKVSGNYVVQIYEDNQQDKPLAQACFSIVEPRVSISAKVRGNTDTELNNRLQQLDFEVVLNGVNVREASTEVKVLIRQNNRIDNEVSGIQATYISGNKLSYINNKELIFEGGNEFHRFDISSVYAASEGIDEIKYVQPHYEVFLTPDKIQTSRNYMHEFDVNGKFVINYQEAMSDSNYEADYMWVNFRLPAKSPFFDGQVYLGGDFNYNIYDGRTRMMYDNDSQQYYQKVLLKQGGYNYQHRFVPKNSKKAFVERVDGSYWQTGNEYSIYIYHRGWGERYDKLVGVKQIQ